MTNHLSIESQYKRPEFYNKENVNNLVRILARFGTIPKIWGINIISDKANPESFKINPGRSIKIGSSLLNQPVVALIYLRYGIEWQIWYKALKNSENSVLLADLASLQVSKVFYDLLPKRDKASLKDVDDFLISYIKKDGFQLEALIKDTGFQAKLKNFHNIETSPDDFNHTWMPVLENLALPTEYLLMSGGDLRLNIDEENLLNKYGCRPFPRPKAFTFASSTATSVSNFAFDKTERERTQLIQKSLNRGFLKTTKDFSEQLKTNLRKALDIDSENQIIFSPSGTDSSLQIAAMAQIVSPNKKITHVLVASDESGSGVPGALLGNHFENNTALGYPVKKGERINGFKEVDLDQIKLRDSDGVLKTDAAIDEEVYKKVIDAHKKGMYVVLHAMDQSKLGYQSPSEELIKKLEAVEDLSMQIIIDGSQLRLDPEDINGYLKKGYVVTITGSKYFTGPPYAGALIVPEIVSKQIKGIKTSLPEGLTEYYNRSEWPANWQCAENLSDGYNYGTYMRWNAAIAEMDRYFKTPILYRNLGIELFCNFVDESIRDAAFLEPLYKDEEKINTYDSEAFGLRNIRTIFPFFIKKDGKILDIDQVKQLYQLLNLDISGKFPDTQVETQRLAAQKCHIGQAVKVIHPTNKNSAILRISLGARVISESWKNRDISMFFRNIEEQMDQVSVIIRKIDLILNHPDLIN